MPLADFASSAESFAHAATAFFEHLSDIHWTPFALALGCLAGMQLARAWAWRNVLHAAYPGVRISFLELAAAYLAGAGINAIIPAHAGDVTKVFLVKRQIPGSSYPAVTSSFLVQTVFDTTVGLLVLLYAVSQGLLPKPPQLPDLPAFEISFWAEHPQVFLIVLGALLLAIVIAIYLLAHRVRRFWDRVKQGVVILTKPRRYLREVAAWQGRRLAPPLRRLLVLPRGLRHRRLGRQRDAGDERAGDRQHRPLHPRRRRRPAGAPGGDPARPLALRRPLLLGRDADRDGGLVGRARLRRDPARLPHDGLAGTDQAGRRGRETAAVADA